MKKVLMTVISDLICPNCRRNIRNSEVELKDDLSFICPKCDSFLFIFWELTGSLNWNERVLDLVPKDEKNWIKKPKKFNPSER